VSAVGPPDIEAARERIRGHVRRTFCDPSSSLSGLAGEPVWLKLEHQQITGAFKLRGATNAVLRLGPETSGVTAASTGNHGRALAHAARAAGLRCVICMSRLVPRNKVDAIAALGAEIRIVGDSQDDADEEVARLVEEGLTRIPPFDHPDVIAGQGTLGLEMLEDVPDAGLLLVPLSGGGLVAGIAAAAKARRPGIRVVGLTMQRGAAMQASLSAGRPVLVREKPSLADSLGGGIGLANRHTFAMVRDLVDDVILLDENEIAAGIRHAYAEERQVIEGGAAVGIAALLAGRVRPEGPTVVLLSGANIDMALHSQVVAGDTPDLMREAS
jgi:threonine dehydratase